MKERLFIEELLAAASDLVRGRYGARETVKVVSKSEPNDLLTEVDLAVQEYVVARIREAFPDDAIAAEEAGFAGTPADPDGRCWVIDPIDGTQNFVRSLFPAFGVSIAFAEGGVPIAGGVSMPIAHDVFVAERGGGTFRNGRRQQVTAIAEVGLARVEVDFAGREERKETLSRAGKVLTDAGQIRCHCATVVALCSIASGDAEAFVHVGLNPWDFAAGMIIAEEAGGRATRFDGGPVHLFDDGQGVVISNGHIHNELISLLQ